MRFLRVAPFLTDRAACSEHRKVIKPCFWPLEEEHRIRGDVLGQPGGYTSKDKEQETMSHHARFSSMRDNEI